MKKKGATIRAPMHFAGKGRNQRRGILRAILRGHVQKRREELNKRTVYSKVTDATLQGHQNFEGGSTTPGVCLPIIKKRKEKKIKTQNCKGEKKKREN